MDRVWTVYGWGSATYKLSDTLPPPTLTLTELTTHLDSIVSHICHRPDCSQCGDSNFHKMQLLQLYRRWAGEVLYQHLPHTSPYQAGYRSCLTRRPAPDTWLKVNRKLRKISPIQSIYYKPGAFTHSAPAAQKNFNFTKIEATFVFPSNLPD